MDGGLGAQFDSDTAPGVLTVDLAALRENYRVLATRLTPARAAAVVKADGYGLGASRIAPALFDAGCRDFFIAHLHEALPLKALLPSEARLFVLNGLQPGAEARCAASGIIPVMNSLEQLEAWSSCAGALGQELPAVMQFDTGMSRLGISEADAQMLAAQPERLRGVRLLFLMSHLASADEPASPQNGEQLTELHKFAARFPGVDLCLANSGGIFLDSGFHGALVRPGIALYGGAPTVNIPNPMKPVVRLNVRVIQTRGAPAGARVGYSATYVAKTATRLATIAAGYADGLPHALSNRGAAYFGGTRLPIVGRVSMDTITLDISALPAGTLPPGSLVEIIGPNQTLEQIAADAGTISYEILTRLGRRYHRHYC